MRMKRLIFFGLSIFALGCKTESDVDPATGSFMRYYGSEKNHTAVKAIEVSDGFAMLSNVEIPIEGTTDVGYKIKLIKTDFEGNQVWEKSYPEFIEGNAQIPGQNIFTASSFIPLTNSGYLIIGDRINLASESTDLLLLHVDESGNMLDSTTISPKEMNLTGASLHGTAVLENATSPKYIVLSRIEWPTSSQTKDMIVAEVNMSDYSISWTRQYGAGQGTLINKILTTPDNNLFWGGSVLSYGQHDIRLIKAPEDSDLASIGSPLLTFAEEELANDFCPVPGGYVITGSTSAAGGDEDIFVMKVTTNAGLVFNKTMADSDLDFGLNDRGNSISTSKDGALIVLATVESTETQEDLYLIKVNPATGDVMWKNNFGGTDQENGASVQTLGDGSFLLFGTSYFGRVKKLMLIKVKSDGKL